MKSIFIHIAVFDPVGPYPLRSTPFVLFTTVSQSMTAAQVRIQRGGQGVRTPPPPGKSQVIWVSIGNKQLDPPPLEKVGPPPLENVGPPLEPWK